jgi:acetyl-CoA carboxylase carboxyltransferase component
MGLEGAVRLGLRKELEAIADDAAREEAVQQATAAAQANAAALNAASMFEIDDVIDPAETRSLLAATLAAAEPAGLAPPRRFVDTW